MTEARAMASPGKKMCIRDEYDFSEYPKTLIKQLVKALEKIVIWGLPCLTPLKILNSNAADGNCGVSFSKAYCCIADKSNKRFAFSDIFERGIDILMAFVEKQELPENRREKFVLSKLLNYLAQKAAEFPCENLGSYKETELTSLLANHLFGELATSSLYVIDENHSGKQKDKCLCGRNGCTLTGTYGDTSVGHEHVWHGNLDVIINDEIPVDIIDSDDPDDSDEPKSSPGRKEVKTKSVHLSRNPQMIAETIVFSFLQKRRHPANDNFLVPCIGIRHSEMVVMFYDSEYDVLLESSPIHLLATPMTEDNTPPKISLTLLIVCWLVENCKYLSSGLPGIMQEYRADFFSLAKDKLKVYENELKFGNVGTVFVQGKNEFELDRPRTKSMQEKIRKMTDIVFSVADSLA